MSVDYAALVRKLGEKGMSPADIADVLEAMQGPVPAYAMEATTMNERMLRDLEKVRQRRERDRDRKRAAISAEIPRNSVESAETPETKVSPTPPSKTQPPIPPYNPPLPLFDAFWAAYPNKTGKRAAATAFERALKRISHPDPESLLLGAIDRAKRTRQWREGFIPNPATWLNQDRWEDGIEEARGRDPPRAGPADPAVQASRIQHLRDTGEWRPSWGPRPDEQAA